MKRRSIGGGRRRVPLLSILGLCVALEAGLGGCATDGNLTLSTNDPFSRQLNTLDAVRINSGHWLLASGAALGVGVIAGTTFSTLHSLNLSEPPASTIGIVSSYGVSILAVGAGIWAALRYNRSVSEYLNTLRLETQYYNLVSAPGGGK